MSAQEVNQQLEQEDIKEIIRDVLQEIQSRQSVLKDESKQG